MKPEQNTDSIIALIGRIREEANLQIIQMLSRYDINDLLPAHGSVLHTLFTDGPMQMKALAEAIGRKKNTVTGLIKTLEDRGYCRRQTDPNDARGQIVALTEKGEAVRQVQDQISDELLNKVWRGIGQSERLLCVNSLNTILKNLQK